MTLGSVVRGALKVLGFVACALGIVATFVVSTVLAVTLHLGRPATRRAIATQANGILKPMFEGEIRVERIGALGLGGLDGVVASVIDPSGAQVLRVEGVGARFSALAAAKSAIFGSGPIVIDVPSAWVGHVDANLDTDAEGNLRIANSFLAKEPSPPPPRNEPPGRGVQVNVPKVRLRHAWVHGSPADGFIVDTDVSDVAAHVRVEPEVTRAELEQLHFVTRAMPQGANPRGALRGTFATPAMNGQGFDVEAVFEGDAMGIPTTLEAKMVDRKVDVRLDAHDRSGARTGAVAEIATHEPLFVHAEVHGDLSELDAKVNAALGKATVEAKAVVELAKTMRVVAEVAAREVDVATLAPGAPSSKLGLDARAKVAMRDGGVFGNVEIDTLPGTVDRKAIPPAEIRGAFEGLAAQIRARVRDPNMPTEIAVDVRPRGEGGDARTITGTVRSRVPSLQRLPVVGDKLEGAAEVEAYARVAFPEAAIEESRARVEVTRFKAESLGVGKVTVKAKAAGTVDSATVDANVHVSELLAGTIPFASVDANARVERTGEVITVRDTKVQAVRPAGDSITANVKLVRVAGQSLRASGVEVTGLGEPIRADVTKEGRSIRGGIDAPKIDLPLVARILGKDAELGVTKGTFGIKGEGQLRGGVAKAKMHAEVRDLAMKSVRRGDLNLDAAIDGRDVDVDLVATVGETGKVAIRTDRVVLGGPLDDPKAFRDIAGKVHLTAEVDMARAMRFVPPEQLPVADLHGILSVQGRVGRDSPNAPPEVQLHTHTNGLGFATLGGEPEQLKEIRVEKASPVRASNFDIGLDIRNDGLSGLTNVAFRATDKNGVLAAFDAKAIVPYEKLLRDPNAAREVLVTTPLGVKLTVPPRRFEELPAILAPSGIGGAFSADFEASGTVAEPRVHMDVRARNIRAPAMPQDVDADSDVTFDYDGSVAGLIAKVSSRGKELADIGARAEIRSRDLLERSKSGGFEDLPWNASAKAKLAAFPLESLPQLSERRVRGNVSGEFSLDGLHEDAVAKGEILFDGLKVGEAEYPKGRIFVDTSNRKLVAQVRLEQKDGNLDLEASSGLAWGKALAPTLDDGQPISARLLAKAFRAAAIQPFIENAVPAFDGRIDANATAQLVPGKPGAALDGSVTFRDGTVLVAALGEELRGVKATVRLTPDGQIRVTDVGAKGTQGEVYADANVKLDGTRLADATANVRIPNDKPLTMAVQGTPLGRLAGKIVLKAKQSPDGKDTTVAIEIPTLGVELPQVVKAGVQSLETKENVHVGVFRSRRRFVELPLDESTAPSTKKAKEEKAADPSRLDVDVRLGKITIERGNQLRVEVTGNPKIAIEGGETKITGQVSVARGWVDVQGKKFEIEKGIVTFNGESPPDPVIVATAAWTASDGSRIYADFVGPVATGKVTLRSEPPRPQNEILAVILFGTADGANPPPQQQRQGNGTTKTAASLGGGYLAQGLTEALDDLGGVQATARIDSTSSNNPRPELTFQVSPKVSVGFAYVIGTPPITEPDKSFANVEYRFRKNWSFETTFGDRGSSLFDAIWQKRY